FITFIVSPASGGDVSFIFLIFFSPVGKGAFSNTQIFCTFCYSQFRVFLPIPYGIFLKFFCVLFSHESFLQLCFHYTCMLRIIHVYLILFIFYHHLQMIIFLELLQNYLFYQNIENMVLGVNFSIWPKKLLQQCCILVHSQELNYFMKKMGVKKVY